MTWKCYKCGTEEKTEITIMNILKEKSIEFVMNKVHEGFIEDFSASSLPKIINQFFDQYQPECSDQEDNEDPVMKYLAPLCDTIIRLE